MRISKKEYSNIDVDRRNNTEQKTYKWKDGRDSQINNSLVRNKSSFEQTKQPKGCT